MKYSGLRVPSDPLKDLEQEISDDETEETTQLIGNMPVLVIDLVNKGLMAPEEKRIAGLGSLTLYEEDLVLDRVEAYAQLYPISDRTKLNLLEHIAFKIKQLEKFNDV